jgi:hypothetical protein
MGRAKDLSGQKFSRLTATTRIGTYTSPNGHTKYAIWECVCDCGNITTATSNMLVTGNKKSCGCLHKDRVKEVQYKGEGVAAFNLYWFDIQARARKRGNTFTLTQEDVKEISKSDCYYCGEKPSMKKTTKQGESFVFNGIDRKDNAEGYTRENSLPCCKACNQMKSDRDYDEFVAHISKVYATLNSF